MMKKAFVLLAAVVLAAGMAGCKRPAGQGQGKEPARESRITISGAWALYPLAVRWAEEYMKINPEVKVDVSAGGAGKGMADALSGAVDIGMVSREIDPAEQAKGAWWVSVAKDSVVVVVNSENPLLKDMLARGVTRKSLEGVWMSVTVADWNVLAGMPTGKPVLINSYTRSDACGAAETWAKYLGGKQEDLKGLGVYGDPGIAEAVKKDVLGIGYNNIGFAYDAQTGAPVAGLAILPIDLNENGRIDPDESFYEKRDLLMKAIAEDKYPSPPSRALHFVTKAKASGVTAEFLKWVLNEGQQYVSPTGFIPLPEPVMEEQKKKLSE